MTHLFLFVIEIEIKPGRRARNRKRVLNKLRLVWSRQNLRKTVRGFVTKTSNVPINNR